MVANSGFLYHNKHEKNAHRILEGLYKTAVLFDSFFGKAGVLYHVLPRWRQVKPRVKLSFGLKTKGVMEVRCYV